MGRAMGRAGRLVLPGLMTAAMLVATVGLGFWQLQRLQWKTAMLDRIAAAEVAPPVPFGPSAPPFAKVVVSGTFRAADAALYGAEVRDLAGQPRLGGEQIVPLDRLDGPSLLVVRGWVPDSAQHAGIPVGPVSVQGYVRPADHATWLSARDDTAARRFFTLDPAAIGRALGVALAPEALVALGPATATPPIPAAALPRPVNNHLSYALTWFAFAIILFSVFAVWARGALRG